MFERFFRKYEPKEVYCQNCGDELTKKGGDVANDESIYCHGYKDSPLRCIEQVAIKGMKAMFADYQNPDEVQKDILKGKLVSFGPLEKEV